jgi:hypothetical protein
LKASAILRRVPFDDTLEDFVLACLERVEQRLNDLDHLDAGATTPQRQRVQEDLRRELRDAEAAIRTFVLDDDR